MPRSEFTQLSALLPQTIHQYQLGKQVKGAWVCHCFRRLVAEHCGESAYGALRTIFFKDGVLTVGVQDSSWAQTLQLKKHTLLEKLLEACLGVAIKEIRMKVG